MLGCCAIAALIGRGAGQTVGETGGTSLMSGQTTAVWSAEGQWVFARSNDATGTTSIEAINVSDGARKELRGYWPVAVEPVGARARVVKDPGTSLQSIASASIEPSGSFPDIGTMSFVARTSCTGASGAESLLWPNCAVIPSRSSERTGKVFSRRR